MAAAHPQQQFSEEKILADSPEITKYGHEDKEVVQPSDTKIAIVSQEELTLNPSKQTSASKDTTDEKQVSPSNDEKQISTATDQKEVLASNPGKIAASNLDALQTEKFTTTPSTKSVSQTETSRSTRSSGSYREHSFCHASALRLNHNVVVDPNGQASYFIEVSGFAKGRDDVVVHSIRKDIAHKGNALTPEQGKVCPAVAFAQFPHGRDNFIQIGLGDHHHMSSIRWLELSRDSERADWSLHLPGKPSRIFTLATNLDSASIASMPSPISPLDSKSSTGSFRLVDDSTGAIVASYSELKAMSSWKKRGKLRIYDRVLESVDTLSEDELELIIIVCCATMNEKRRRANVRKWTGMSVF